MATKNVPAGTAPAILTTDGIAIPEQRLTLAQESAWELDALRETINDLCSDLGDPDLTQCHLMALRLKIRGLTMRMGQLASVLMSVLDHDDTTEALHKMVHGQVLAKEVAHHG